MTLLVSPSIGRRMAWTRCHYGTTCWLIGYQDEMRYLSGCLYLWRVPTLEAMTRTHVPDQSIFQTEPLLTHLLYGQIQNFRCLSWQSCKGVYNELFIKVNNWNIFFKDKSCTTLPQPIVNVKAAKVLHGWAAEFVVFWQLQSMVWCVMFVCWSPS